MNEQEMNELRAAVRESKENEEKPSFYNYSEYANIPKENKYYMNVDAKTAHDLVGKAVDMEVTCVAMFKKENSFVCVDKSTDKGKEFIEATKGIVAKAQKEYDSVPKFFNSATYNKIEDKQFVNVDKTLCSQLVKSAQEQNIAFAAVFKGDNSNFVVSKSDEKAQAFLEANSGAIKENQKELRDKPKYFNRSDYDKIENKQTITLDRAVAGKVVNLAKEQGLTVSAMFKGEKGLVTLDRNNEKTKDFLTDIGYYKSKSVERADEIGNKLASALKDAADKVIPQEKQEDKTR